MQQLITVLILFGFFAWFVARSAEDGFVKDLCARFGGLPRGARWLLVALLALGLQGQVRGGKGEPAVQSLFRLLFWHGDAVYSSTLASAESLAAVDGKVAAASNSFASASSTRASALSDASAAAAMASTQQVVTLSFDWHVPSRLPEAQNVMGWTAWVQPTNIAGVLYEDHYVAFNAQASTNPVVVNIEYARGDERVTAEVVTNSYPQAYPVSLPSGVHTCYWFRCAVPLAFVSEQRDWNGEALFGAPPGSGNGFDLLGTLVVDDGNNFWLGVTTNAVFGGITNEFKNGINVTPEAP